MLQITQNTILRVQNFIRKTLEQKGFRSLVLGMSGGIDSALVCSICANLKDIDLFALMMPSSKSNPKNLLDAKNLCETLGVPYRIIELSSFESAFLESESENAVLLGNFCARVRGALLYNESAKRNALVIGTSNKSELMLGYGTLCGDLAHALNPLAPFFKTQIFELAKLINLPSEFLSKPPSADLWEGQSDESELGYRYSEIDKLLYAIDKELPNIYSLDKLPDLSNLPSISKLSFPKDMIDAIARRIEQNLFKHKPSVSMEISHL